MGIDAKPACRLCKSTSAHLMEKDGHSLYICSECRLVFVWPQPTEAFLKNELYSAESGYQANRAEDITKLPEPERAARVFGFLEKEISGGAVLDVGCSGGHFMQWAKLRGFKPKGVELNRLTAESARKFGFEVFNGFLAEAPFDKSSFDAVFLGEIIEHVTDPRALVRQCASFLRPGGFIAITTPNLDCFWSRATFRLYQLFGIPWSSVTPPYHLFQFDDRNLDLLMSQEGFTFAHSDYLPPPPLRYELGMLHLLKRYKASRSLKDLGFMAFAYALYSGLHLIVRIVHPFIRKDFSMIRIYALSVDQKLT